MRTTPLQSSSKFFSGLPGNLAKASQFSAGTAAPCSTTSPVTGVGMVVGGVELDTRAAIKHDLDKGSYVVLVSRDDDLVALDLHVDLVGKLLEFPRSDRSDVQTPQEIEHFLSI